MRYRNREEAGRRLAAALTDLSGQQVVVLGLPRGGVPVAAEIARVLRAPLDVVVVRKLGVPSAPELAMGAIGEHGVRVLNESVLRDWGLSADDVDRVEIRERRELEARVRRFRHGHPPMPLTGRTAVVVDDGVATGATARAACRVVRELGAERVVLATPVASPRALDELRKVTDEVVCLRSPSWFAAVGEAYRDFRPVTDDQVAAVLSANRRHTDVGEGGPSLGVATRTEVVIPASDAELPGSLVLPAGARAVVIFAHGSGSSRHSPRNRQVADRLNDAGLGTLLLDLLTGAEEPDRSLVFDVDLLADRLLAATSWLRGDSGVGPVEVGYFGASTGAAAALWAAADPSARIAAVVSRGGRPDLAAARLHRVTAPTLLIVGGADDVVLRLNERAAAMMHAEVRIDVVPDATHLFEEPGALDEVAELAADWFTRHLRTGSPAVHQGNQA